MSLKRLALTWCLAAAAASGRAQEPASAEAAALDGSGVLWVFSRANAGEVYRFDGQRWETQSTALPGNGSPVPAAAATLSDGAVVCLWRLDEQQFAAVRYAGRESRWLGAVEGKLPFSGLKSRPLADEHGQLWVADTFPRIYRVSAEGVRVAHALAPAELVRPRPEYNAMHATADGRGRLWLWSDADISNYATLRGVLVLDGDQAETRDPCATLAKGTRVSALARADENHLWMAVATDGIYRVDTESLALERLPDPSPQALDAVAELFVHGGDLYAVQKTSWYAEVLWRWREGRWEEVLPVLDPGRDPWNPRPWLPVEEGLLVGTYDSAGPWFIPHAGPPVRCSWRNGFPLQDVHTILRLPDGTFFALGRGSEVYHRALALPPAAGDDRRTVAIDTDKGWVVDAAGWPWTMERRAPRVLLEWNGETWVEHPVPKGADEPEPTTCTLGYVPDFHADREGRIWVFPLAGYKLHVFDTRSRQWSEFANLSDALAALRGTDPAHFLTADEFLHGPQYSPDGERIAYRAQSNELAYYDGTEWLRITRERITGKKGAGAVGPPWFDKEGQLCVNLRPETTWRRDDAGKWAQIPFESHFPTDGSEGTANAPRPEPPEGSVTSHPDSLVTDHLGTAWLTLGQQLYRCVPGRCVAVFGTGEANPFLVKRLLRQVFVDARGNAFVQTASARMEAFIIKPRHAPPHVELAVEAVETDAVRVRLHTDSTLPMQYRWRLDEGPWQATAEDTWPLASLPAGSHRLAVAGVDAELQTGSPPAVATFDIKVDPAQQMAGLIARLSDPDYARRKAAVQAFALQPPDRASAALRQARATAGEDARWWIDAAWQQIEQTKQAGTGDAGKSPFDPRN